MAEIVIIRDDVESPEIVVHRGILEIRNSILGMKRILDILNKFSKRSIDDQRRTDRSFQTAVCTCTCNLCRYGTIIADCQYLVMTSTKLFYSPSALRFVIQERKLGRSPRLGILIHHGRTVPEAIVLVSIGRRRIHIPESYQIAGCLLYQKDRNLIEITTVSKPVPCCPITQIIIPGII